MDDKKQHTVALIITVHVDDATRHHDALARAAAAVMCNVPGLVDVYAFDANCGSEWMDENGAREAIAALYGD